MQTLVLPASPLSEILSRCFLLPACGRMGEALRSTIGLDPGHVGQAVGGLVVQKIVPFVTELGFFGILKDFLGA
jgi:hypothetical protein